MVAQAIYDSAPRKKNQKPPQLINTNPWRRGLRATITPRSAGPSPAMMAAIRKYQEAQRNGG